MRRYYNKAFGLATSSTAKDTYILFVGNILSAFFGFLYTLIVARALTVPEFGVFSAALNLVFIIVGVADLGISGGLVNFVADAISKGKTKKADMFKKSAFQIRIVAVTVVVLLLFLIAPYIGSTLLATDAKSVVYLVAIVSATYLIATLFPFILQAERRFSRSAIIEASLGLVRFAVAALFLIGGLTLVKALGAFAVASIFGIIVGFVFVGTRFLKVDTKKDIHVKLLKFSGWLGLTRVVGALAGRLDITMLAAIAGAAATGFYSIPSRLSLFVSVLTSSFASVLAPRLASFGDKAKEKSYITKAFLATLPIVAGIIVWIFIAGPFIVTLFGAKYALSVPIFRALLIAMIPFVLTAPSVTAIIYAIKKPIYIGLFSVFQLILIFSLNYILIPRFGPIGPTITLAIVNTLLAIYTWSIVIKHYWVDK